MIRRFLKYCFSNWKLKILAIAIAIALFIIVRNDKDTEARISINVKYINQPETLTLMNELIFQVKLVVRGPWTRVHKLDRKTLNKELLIDLSKVRGERYELDSTMFKLLKGIRVVSISPSFLPIRMESILTRTVPITLGKIKTARFLKITDVKIIPYEVSLTGPKSDVLSVLSIPLSSVKITKTGKTELKLKLPQLPPRITVKPDIKEITVTVTIENEQDTKQINAIPILIDGDPSLYRLVPSYVDVIIKGDKKSLFSFSPSVLKPFIAISKNETRKSFFLKVKLKNQLNNFRYMITPQKIKVYRILPPKPDDKKTSGKN
jgi:YbbR domain-containing protein